MHTSIKTIIVSMVLVVAFQSCDQGPSLQKFYVDNELKPGFTSVDIPTSFLNIDESKLSEVQREAYESVDKLNMLGFFLNDDNQEEYEMELAKITEILKDPQYEELMRGGNSTDGKFVVKFIGEVDEIDELILFGHANDKGFAVIRILGDDMNANKLMTLKDALDYDNLNDEAIGSITEIFQ